MLNREKRKDGPPDDLHTLQLQLIGESGVMNAHRVEVDPGRAGRSVAGAVR